MWASAGDNVMDSSFSPPHPSGQLRLLPLLCPSLQKLLQHLQLSLRQVQASWLLAKGRHVVPGGPSWRGEVAKCLSHSTSITLYSSMVALASSTDECPL